MPAPWRMQRLSIALALFRFGSGSIRARIRVLRSRLDVFRDLLPQKRAMCEAPAERADESVVAFTGLRLCRAPGRFW